MKTLDRVFGCLMFLGGIGHGIGSYKAYGNDHMALLWAWSASLAVFLLAGVNLLRAGRPADRALAWISLGGCVSWMACAAWFGQLIGNMLDFRPLLNFVVALVLAIFSIRSLLQSGRMERVRTHIPSARAQNA
jgi:hypothetical protein